MMRSDCTRERSLGIVKLDKRYVARAHVSNGTDCFGIATCVSFAPLAGMCVLHLGKRRPSARCGEYCVLG